MQAGALGFSNVWTLEFLARERTINRLCQAARLAATDFSANRDRVRQMVEDLAYELDSYEVTLPPENWFFDGATDAEPVCHA